MTYDTAEDHFINRNKNNKCSSEISGAWWTSCDRKTNLNSFEYDEMLFQANKSTVSKVLLSGTRNEYKTLRKILSFQKNKVYHSSIWLIY